MKRLFLFLPLTALLSSAFANVRLPAVISSNMVLQQKSRTNLWGWSEPAEKIYVTTSWNGAVDSVVATSGGRWKISIPTPAAGGPYTITLKGNNKIVLENILIGEVWVCSGQSNMEWSSNNNVKLEDLPNTSNPNIRLFHIPKTTSMTPQDDCVGQWQACSSASLRGFSAIGYFFGKRLQEQLNVPIGLISTSWGGTPAETWIPTEDITKDDSLSQSIVNIPKNEHWPTTAGDTYNAMIYPITSYAIAGAIWYQGEGNTPIAASYGRSLSTLIRSWRSSWKEEFPFYYVQIAPYTYGYQNVAAVLREQQTRTQALPHTGMIVITDLVNDIKNIHPIDKLSVGNRLANLALGDTYQLKGFAFRSPSFRNMEVNKDKATVFFNDAPNGFSVKGNDKPSEFYIAGADQQFYPADVKLEKDRVILSAKQVKEPVAVRFAYSNTAVSNLFSKEGLPIAPFRTDNWPVNMEKIQ